MADFYEIWDLRNKLIGEGYYTPSNEVLDGREEEQKIWELAREHYNWKQPEPDPMPRPSKEYEEFLSLQTSESRLKHIHDIALDWDGYSTVRGLGSLIDEIIACTIPKCMTDNEALEQVKLVKMYNGVEDFLSSRVSDNKLPFTWNFLDEDMRKVDNWCNENGYCAKLREVNYSSTRELIGCVVTIDRKDKENESI